MNTETIADDPMLRLPEVKRATGLSRSTIYRKIADKTFPPQHKVGDQAVGWPESVIRAWRASRAPTSALS